MAFAVINGLLAHRICSFNQWNFIELLIRSVLDVVGRSECSTITPSRPLSLRLKLWSGRFTERIQNVYYTVCTTHAIINAKWRTKPKFGIPHCGTLTPVRVWSSETGECWNLNWKWQVACELALLSTHVLRSDLSFKVLQTWNEVQTGYNPKVCTEKCNLNLELSKISDNQKTKLMADESLGLILVYTADVTDWKWLRECLRTILENDLERLRISVWDELKV